MEQFIELLELVTALGGAITGKSTDTAVALEQIALKAAEMYRAESGLPLDLGKLGHEDPV